MLGSILYVLCSLLARIGSTMLLFLLLLLTAPTWAELQAAAPFVALGLASLLQIVGLLLADRALRKKYNRTDKQVFSVAWTVLSVIAIFLLYIMGVLCVLELIPIYVIVCGMILYILLSAWMIVKR